MQEPESEMLEIFGYCRAERTKKPFVGPPLFYLFIFFIYLFIIKYFKYFLDNPSFLKPSKKYFQEV